jgi:hypothetical protein
MEENEAESNGRIEQYQIELAIELDVPDALNKIKSLFKNPWQPFTDSQEFKLGGWFLDACVGKTQMNRFFNLGLAPSKWNCSDSELDSNTNFRLAYHFRKLLVAMNHNEDYGDPMEQWRDGVVNYREADVDHPVTFHYRNLEPILKEFFSEPWFQDKLVFLPEKKIRADGVTMYTEMHTGEWWWNTQVS